MIKKRLVFLFIMVTVLFSNVSYAEENTKEVPLPIKKIDDSIITIEYNKEEHDFNNAKRFKTISMLKVDTGRDTVDNVLDLEVYPETSTLWLVKYFETGKGNHYTVRLFHINTYSYEGASYIIYAESNDTNISENTDLHQYNKQSKFDANSYKKVKVTKNIVREFMEATNISKDRKVVATSVFGIRKFDYNEGVSNWFTKGLLSGMNTIIIIVGTVWSTALILQILLDVFSITVNWFRAMIYLIFPSTEKGGSRADESLTGFRGGVNKLRNKFSPLSKKALSIIAEEEAGNSSDKSPIGQYAPYAIGHFFLAGFLVYTSISNIIPAAFLAVGSWLSDKVSLFF